MRNVHAQIQSNAPSVKGSTLIELMIALTISLVIIAAVGFVYLGNRQAQQVQLADSRTTEDMRFALETLTRDLRVAGRMGCVAARPGPDSGAIQIRATGAVMTPTRAGLGPMLNAQTNGARDGTGTNVQSLTMENGWFLRGFTAGNGYTGPDAGRRDGNSDILQIIKSGNSATQIAADMANETSDISLAARLGGASPGSGQNLFVVSDCFTAEIVRGSVNNSATAQGGLLALGNAAGNNLNVGNTLNKAYTSKDWVSVFEPAIYMVQQANPGFRRLVRYNLGPLGAWDRQPTIIADRIEDMRIRFAISTSSKTGAFPDSLLTGDQINALGSTPEAQLNLWAGIRAVEISLLVQSQPRETGSQDQPVVQKIIHTIDLRNLKP